MRSYFLRLFAYPSAITCLSVLACGQTGTVYNLSSLTQPETAHAKAAEELKTEEQQRILGLIPDFNTSNVENAAPLDVSQKFDLALKGNLDPSTFVVAGLDAGLSQWQKSSPGFGYGIHGYARRFEASYADAFDGALLGNAVFPALLHQDPRYFRQGSGPVPSRLVHAMLSAVRSKNDDGTWTWNYSNVLGNLTAGAIATAYYPATDRSASLVISRALTVTAEGAIGAVFCEFWPDISRRLVKKRS